MRETWIGSLGQEDPLEDGMASHSSILAWKIPWTEEPGRLHTVHGVRHNGVTKHIPYLYAHTNFRITCYNLNIRKKAIVFKQRPLIIFYILSLWFTFLFYIFVYDTHTDNPLLYASLSFFALIFWFCVFNFLLLFMVTKATDSVCTKDFTSWQSTDIS